MRPVTKARWPVSLVMVCFVQLSIFSVTLVTAEEPMQPSTESGVTITYLANEGIMISFGQKHVLVDALFRSRIPGYDHNDPDIQTKLESAQSPFDNINAILMTHYHADHFSVDAVTQHLLHNKNTVLVTSEQVAEQMQANSDAYEKVKSQIHPHDPTADATSIDEASGVRIEVVKLSHGGGRFAETRNMGFIIHMGGKRILHVGDSQISKACFEPLKKFAQGVDVACIPHWMLESKRGAAFIRDEVQPKHIVAFHIMPEQAQAVTARILANLPDATIFTKKMTQKTF